jgi:Undecaprenyl-phosphate galactose phosphotransferase WbaP
MSTAARPALAVTTARSTDWAPWAIFLADIFALELAFTLGLALRRLLAPLFTLGIGPAQYTAVAIAMLIVPMVHYQLGLYPGYLLGPVERLRRRTLSTLAVFGGLLAWDALVARGVLSRGVLLATFAFALVLPPLAELCARSLLIARGRWGIRAVVLGSAATGNAIVSTLLRDPELGLKPVALLHDVARAANYEDQAECAIIALENARGRSFDDLNFPRVIVVPDLQSLANLWVTARDLNGSLGLEIKKNLLIRRNIALKRILDCLVALPMFILAIPILVWSGILIKLLSPGPMFYKQEREGFDGRRLAVWKLRTMHTNSESILTSWLGSHPEDKAKWERFFKLPHDPRIIPIIGKFLRRTSLDELPQLWSVLTGEMSLVGPRPFPDYHLKHFAPDFRTLRVRVLPGLTGLWQISARSDGDVEVQQALDTYYIRNWSPWLDLYILARTVATVLLARGAY